MDKYTVISSRVRLARNIEGIKFPVAITQNEVNEVQSVGTGVAKSLFEGQLYKMCDLTREEIGYLTERRLISPMLAGVPFGSVYVSQDKSFSVMMCEEDHIRAQAFGQGLSLINCFENVKKYDMALRAKARLAYHKQFGYLTACPTNVGTGMRASVMMFLPALSVLGGIDKLAAELKAANLTLRGAMGEGSRAEGFCYQISNCVSLGVTEDTIINRVTSAAERIVQIEHDAFVTYVKQEGLRLQDAVMRSYGVLKNCKLLSYGEFCTIAVNVKIGELAGYITLPQSVNMDDLMLMAQPYSVMRLTGCGIADEQRDAARAEMLQKIIDGKEGKK